MSVWYCIPSARPPEEADKCLSAWKERGYKIALWRDDAAGKTFAVRSDALLHGSEYPGYAGAVNELVLFVMRHDPDAEWFVTGGDDVWPDPNHTAEEIAQECSDYFCHIAKLAHMNQLIVEEEWSTFGVMQPTGDRWGARGRAYIDHVAGSPWMGREFCRRINQGKGPLWPEYFHMGEDEELQAVATKLGVFWQRPDLTHYHDHWGRSANQNMPEFLTRANSWAEWRKYKALFQARQAAGFPGHEPLEVG